MEGPQPVFCIDCAVFMRDATVATAHDARSALGLNVTPGFFTTLGVGPLLGRTISDTDTTGPPSVVLSYGFWQRLFGGSDRVIGNTVVLSGTPHQIVGVMPRDFESRVLDMRFDFWTPFRRVEPAYQQDGIGPVALIGRLREGVTIAAARSEVAAITLESESRYQSNFNGFLIQLASLQAIGSSRSRLIRQFLAESLFVTFLGAVAGVALAAVAVRLFIAWNPLGTLPAHPIQLDVRALAVAVIAVAVTVLVSGLVPAMRVSQADPIDALRSGGRSSAAAPARRMQTMMDHATVCRLRRPAPRC
jgi:putative ABC transport system permease protein